MITKTLSFSLASIVIALVAGCDSKDSSEVAPDTPVFQDYRVIYNRTNNSTEAKASFRRLDDDGVRLRLSGESNVRFNGDEEDAFTTLSNYFYTWRRNGLLTVAITYTKSSGTSFENVFEPEEAPDIGIPANFEELTIGEPNFLTWEGPALKQKEAVTLTISQGDRSPSEAYILEAGATSIDVGNALSLGEWKPGKAEIRLSRDITKDQIQHEDGTAGGRIILETVVVKEVVLR